MVAVHSTARGPALGGCRMWVYEESRSAIRDVLRLSGAMTFKAAVAGLPLGGGKGVIVLQPDEAVLSLERRRAALLDFGDTVEALAGAYVTAEDVGTSVQDMEVIAEQTRGMSSAFRRTAAGPATPARGRRSAARARCGS
jgi:leucine dehydrogenase